MGWRSGVAALLAFGLLAGVASWLFAPRAAPDFDRAIAATALVDAPPRDAGARVRYPAGREPVLTAPDGSRRTVASLLNVRQRMHYGDYAWDEAAVPAGPVWVQVDLARQIVSVFRSGEEIGAAVILYGSDGKPTPTGVFPVMQKARDHRSSLYDAAMPFMLRLTGDGVAIHASDVRRGRATHGCIGVPPAFAEKLFAVVARGDPVVILPPQTVAQSPAQAPPAESTSTAA